MNKQEFLARLEAGLSGLPKPDAEERLAFYGEMIDDRVEEGLTEEEAVAEIGPVEDVVTQIIGETPLPRIIKERVRSNRRLQAWEIVLLVLGLPLWLPLLIAAAAVLFSGYVVIWSLILALWAVELSFAVSSVAVFAGGIILICQGMGVQGLAAIGAGLVLAGLSILLFFGCLAASKGAIVLTKKIAMGIKSLFLRKEQAE